MNTKILGVGIAAILVVAAIAVFYSLEGTPYWETETVFGAWQEEVFVVFDDGTNKSLKIIAENMGKPFTVTYGGKVIVAMGMRISATPTGTGYTGAELKFTSFGLQDRIHNAAGSLITSYNSIRSDTTIQLVMDYPNSIISSTFNLDNIINGHPENYPTGTYTVSFTPTGTVQYRGYPNGGDWVTATLPSARSASISVTNTPPASILITLSPELLGTNQ